jgi:RNA polymerase sigma-70 factor (ECF subfamily)
MAFPTTRWTLLAEATLAGDAHGQKALDDLCHAYRKPVELFLIARGFRNEELEDLVQEFFLRWLRSRAWKRADRALGRFRTFMLGGVMHTLAHHRTRGRTEKRGGGVVPESLDELAENGIEPPCPSASDVMEFDRGWAEALVENALADLARERQVRGREAEFAVLRHFLPGAGEMLTLEDAAERLGSNVNAVKAAVHRLRERFRELVRSAVARSVSAPHEVEEELVYLRSLLLSQPKVSTSVEKDGKKNAE